jgi:hypothetical protein
VAGGPRAGRLDRTLSEHGDALFDFALAVTGDPDRATQAVYDAVPAAVDAQGPTVGEAALLGAVLDAALRYAEPSGIPLEELFRPGPGSPGELQHVARAATQLLDPHQRGVLDLALRQRLGGEGLSEALGIRPGLVRSTTQAALDEAEQVVGAVLLARLGQEDCHGLAETLQDPAVTDSGRRTAAVNEHVEQCPTCGDRRRALVPVTSLLASMPATPAPAELRRRLLHDEPPGPPPPADRRPRPHRRRRLPSGRVRNLLAAGVVAVVVASVSVGVAARRGSGPPSAARPPAGQLTLPTKPVDFGPSDVNSSLVVANTGREPLDFRVQPEAPWLRAVDGQGRLAPGEVAVVEVAVDRSGAPEGDAISEFRVQSSGGSGVVPVRVGVERPPVLSRVEATPQVIVQLGCLGSTPAQVRAMVVEESGIGHAELHWRGPDGTEQVAEMVGDGPSSFLGLLGPLSTAGDYLWWVSATDIRGNASTSGPEPLRVSGC